MSDCSICVVRVVVVIFEVAHLSDLSLGQTLPFNHGYVGSFTYGHFDSIRIALSSNSILGCKASSLSLN